MSYKWVTDLDHPDGYLVEMTAAEEAQLAADRAAWLATSTRYAEELANASVLRARLEAALSKLVQGADATKNGTLFADRSVNERAYLELLGRSGAATIRVLLRRLEGTD